MNDLALLPNDPPVCLLAADGSFTPDDRFPLDLDTDGMADLLRQMIITRRLDREFVNLQRQGQLGVYPSCLGQEAAQVGSAAALGEDDWIFPQYRELGCAVVRDLPPEELGHLWRGTWLSTHDPYRYRFALLSIPIGTHALHAVGFAMGAKLAGDPIVAAATTAAPPPVTPKSLRSRSKHRSAGPAPTSTKRAPPSPPLPHASTNFPPAAVSTAKPPQPATAGRT